MTGLALQNTPHISAVVVTHQPPRAVLGNVLLLRKHVASVVVVDNGSDSAATEVLSELEKHPGLCIIRNPQNLGIAAALNQGIRHALAGGCDWVATFDQDSTIAAGCFEAMLSACNECIQPETVALVSPVHTCVGAERRSRINDDRTSAWAFIQVAMTSGSLIRASAFRAIGFYSEPWFIDYVDFEFCLRLRAAGYRLIRANRVSLQHQLGSPEVHSLLGWQVHIKSHSAWRRYYIMRNRLLLYRRYAFRFPGWCLHDLGWLLLDIAKIVVFESQKVDKLRMVLKGLLHGLAGKTGRLVMPPE